MAIERVVLDVTVTDEALIKFDEQLRKSEGNATELEKAISKVNAELEEQIKLEREEAREIKTLQDRLKQLVKLQQESTDTTKQKEYIKEIQATKTALSALEKVEKGRARTISNLEKEMGKLEKASKKAGESGKNAFKDLFDSVADGVPQVDKIRGIFTKFKGAATPIGIVATAVVGLGAAALDTSFQISQIADQIQGLTGVTNREVALNQAAAVKSLASTYNIDLKEAIIATNAAAKNLGGDFNAAIEEVNNALAGGLRFSDEYLENLKEYPSALSLTLDGLSDFNALIAVQQQEGFFNDKLVDTIKEFEISIRELTPATRDAFGNAGLGGALEQFESGAIDAQQLLQLTGRRIQELGPKSKEVGAIMADVFRGAGEDSIVPLSRVFANFSERLNDAKDRMNELGQAERNLFEAQTRLNQALASPASKTFLDNVTNLKAQLIDLTTATLRFLGFEETKVQAIEKERIAVNGLVGQITQTNLKEDERQKLITKLVNQYPDFLGGLDAEKATNEDLRKQLELVNKEYLKKGELVAKQTVIQERSAEIQKKLNAAARTEADLFALTSKLAEKYNVALEEGATINERVFAIQSKFKDLSLSESFGATFDQSGLNSAFNNFVKLTGQANLASKELEKLKEEFGDIKIEIDLDDGDDSGGGGGGGAKIKKKIEDDLKSLGPIQLPPPQLIEGANIQSQLDRTNDIIQDGYDRAVDLRREAYERELMLANEQLAKEEELAQRRLLLTLGDPQATIQAQQAAQEQYYRDTEQAELRFLDNIKQIKSAAGFSQIEENKRINQILIDTNNARLNAEISAENDAKDRKIAIYRATLSGISQIVSSISQVVQTNLDNELKAVEGNKAAEERIRRQFAQKQKRLQLTQAVINVAQGITAALGSAPPPANFILAALTGAAGAIQISAIANAKFRKGGFTSPIIGSKRDETNRKPAGIVHENEWVANEELVKDGTESKMIAYMESVRKGKPNTALLKQYIDKKGIFPDVTVRKPLLGPVSVPQLSRSTVKASHDRHIEIKSGRVDIDYRKLAQFIAEEMDNEYVVDIQFKQLRTMQNEFLALRAETMNVKEEIKKLKR